MVSEPRMHVNTLLGTMDLSASKPLNATFWKFAKFGAFVCYIAACGLLGISLVLAKSDSAGKGVTPIIGASTSAHN